MIGEATKNLTGEFKLKYPEIPWRNIQDTRNKLIHEYFEVNNSPRAGGDIRPVGQSGGVQVTARDWSDFSQKPQP